MLRTSPKVYRETVKGETRVINFALLLRQHCFDHWLTSIEHKIEIKFGRDVVFDSIRLKRSSVQVGPIHSAYVT